MKERPILFNGPMVQALLDGRKTQTRRIIKCICNSWHIDRVLGDWGLSVPPHQWDGSDPEPLWRWTGKKQPKAGDWVEVFQTEVDDHRGGPVSCPFGTVGDRLWVRETWALPSAFDEFSPSNARQKVKPHLYPNCFYIADSSACGVNADYASKGKTRPSIHMPRWASRITLEITGVRVERLNDISEADAAAEGCDGKCPVGNIPMYQSGPFAYHYAQLWESINGPDSWAANPWVWVIEFRKVEK